MTRLQTFTSYMNKVLAVDSTLVQSPTKPIYSVRLSRQEVKRCAKATMDCIMADREAMSAACQRCPRYWFGERG